MTTCKKSQRFSSMEPSADPEGIKAKIVAVTSLLQRDDTRRPTPQQIAELKELEDAVLRFRRACSQLRWRGSFWRWPVLLAEDAVGAAQELWDQIAS